MTNEGYDVDGPPDGPPIVLLHGAILSRTMWRPLVDRLRDRYRCISIDLPGHGALVGDSFSLALAADTVSRIIDLEAGGRGLVVGLSLGGYVAMDLAARSPQRVRGLVLAGATLEPRGIAAVAFLLFGLLLRIAPERIIQSIDIGLMRRLYGPELTAEVLSGGYFARAGGHAVRHLAGRGFRRRLLAYGGPILVVNGGRDVVFRTAERRFVSGIPRLTARRLTGASHLSGIDRPAEMAVEIRAFEEAIGP